MQSLPCFPATTPRARLLAAGYSPLPPCPCGQRLYSRDRANGYSVRVEYADDTGQPVSECPGCGARLTGAWVQRCGEWQERQRNQKADVPASASGSLYSNELSERTNQDGITENAGKQAMAPQSDYTPLQPRSVRRLVTG